MKKLVVFFISILMLLNLISCSKSKASEPAESISSDEALITEAEAAPKIDLDLTNMNYNMISSITFEMLIEPEKYVEKTVKIKGKFYTEIYEEQRYYSVIIWDATQCCPAGMDFIPPDNMKYPDSFPSQEEIITVTGRLKEASADGNLLFYADKVEF